MKDRVALIRAMIKVIDNINCNHFSFEARGELMSIVSQIRKNENNHLLSVSKDAPSQVSYARTVEDKYDDARRVRLPLGRYIMRNLSFDKNLVTDRVLSSFVSDLWAEYSGKSIFVQKLEGEDIVTAYRVFSSTEAHSCMTGDCCRYTELYALNPDKVCMLVFDQIRALLWTTDEGVKVFDRCYPSGHYKIAIFREWARSKGYVLRSNADRLEDDDVVKLTDGKVYNVTLKRSRYFPYLDTFSFGNFISGDKVRVSNSNEGCELTFHNTDGTFSEDRARAYCEFCDCRCDEDEMRVFRGDLICESCYSERVCTCDECGEDFEADDAYSVDGSYYCESCYNDKFASCDRCGEPFLVEDGVTNQSTDVEYCENCAERHLIQCESCGDFWQEKDLEQIDGDYYCKNCYGQCKECGDPAVDDLCPECQDKKEEKEEVCA